MNASWSCGNVSHWIHKDYFQNQGLVIGIVLLVMYVCFMVPQVIVFFSLVFSEPRMLKYSCHRIMIVICVLDMVNLSYALLSTGIYAVTQHLLCTESVYDLANLINQGLTFWYAYSAANIALALNRSLQILNKNYSKQLFDGYRLVLWIIAIAAYAVILHFSASDPIYFFNKQEVISLIMVRRGAKILVNPIHYYNNIAKSIIISLNSFIIFVYIRKEAAQASRSSITTMERNVSIQVVIMTIITDISVISYVITDWEGNPIKSWIFYGTMIQVSWGLLHGLNAIIYLTLNRSVRNSAKQMLSNAVRGRRYATHPSNTRTTNARSPSDAVNSRPERKSSLSQAANQSVVK